MKLFTFKWFVKPPRVFDDEDKIFALADLTDGAIFGPNAKMRPSLIQTRIQEIGFFAVIAESQEKAEAHLHHLWSAQFDDSEELHDLINRVLFTGETEIPAEKELEVTEHEIVDGTMLHFWAPFCFTLFSKQSTLNSEKRR